MKAFISKELLGHPLILGSLGLLAAIAVGSGIYYVEATKVPSAPTAQTVATSTAQTITANGSVEPAQNPDLAFQSGGRVTSVRVAVGQSVSQGQLLASLDTSALAAQRAQAQANLTAQQAKLQEMQAGPRDVDVSAKQTAVASAQSTYANAYTNAATAVQSAYDKSFSQVSSATDNLFSQANSANPTLIFNTTNSQDGVTAANMRGAVLVELSAWKNENGNLSANSSTSDIDTALTRSLAHLAVVRDYANKLIQALGEVVPSSSFSASAAAAAQVSVGSLRDSTNALIVSLQSMQQQLVSDKLNLQSAQDALNQVLAGSTVQDLAIQQAQVAGAQASIDGINAQIANAVVVAPFSGTIASVRVKVGDIVAANTPAISINPLGALQVTVYLSEIDVAKVAVGDQAAVTLDAYGTGKSFPATVVSIDASPTTQSGSSGYKTVLQFTQSDSAITSGMTANVTITPTTK